MTNLEIVLITFILVFIFIYQGLSKEYFLISKKLTREKHKIMLDDGSMWVKEIEE